jgi:hypothetical protein
MQPSLTEAWESPAAAPLLNAMLYAVAGDDHAVCSLVPRLFGAHVVPEAPPGQHLAAVPEPLVCEP